MNASQTQKLEEYLSGLADVAQGGTFQIGALILEVAIKEDAAALMQEKNISVIAVQQDAEIGAALQVLARRLERGQGSALAVKDGLPTGLREVLLRLNQEKVFDARLPGRAERTLLEAIPAGAFVLLMASRDVFHDQHLDQFVSSACSI